MEGKQFTIMLGSVIGLGILAGVLFNKSCKNPKEEIQLMPTKETVDRVNSSDSIAKAAVAAYDEMMLNFFAETDSLKAIIQRQDQVNEVQKVKILALAKEAQLYRKYNDTAAYMTACDTILPKVESLIVENEASRQTNRVLQNSLDSAIGQSSLLIARLEFDRSMLKDQFDSLSVNSNRLYGQNKENEKRANRKFVFGPQAGVTYNVETGKAEPYVGFGVTYKLFSL